jgi:hypothetical protein
MVGFGSEPRKCLPAQILEKAMDTESNETDKMGTGNAIVRSFSLALPSVLYRNFSPEQCEALIAEIAEHTFDLVTASSMSRAVTLMESIASRADREFIKGIHGLAKQAKKKKLDAKRAEKAEAKRQEAAMEEDEEFDAVPAEEPDVDPTLPAFLRARKVNASLTEITDYVFNRAFEDYLECSHEHPFVREVGGFTVIGVLKLEEEDGSVTRTGVAFLEEGEEYMAGNHPHKAASRTIKGDFDLTYTIHLLGHREVRYLRFWENNTVTRDKDSQRGWAKFKDGKLIRISYSDYQKGGTGQLDDDEDDVSIYEEQ